jgi:hypothetical protein
MATMSKRFSIVENIKKLREAKFTEEQAEVVAQIIEQQVQIIHAQEIKLSQFEVKELVTKADLLKAEIRIMLLMAGGFISMFGILARGFAWL